MSMNSDEQTQINRWNDPVGFDNPTAGPAPAVTSEEDLPLPPAPAQELQKQAA
jgi:hypothetical protein